MTKSESISISSILHYWFCKLIFNLNLTDTLKTITTSTTSSMLAIHFNIYIYIIRDTPILNFSADTDSWLFRMILAGTDADSSVRVQIWRGRICAWWCAAPKLLLCSMHKVRVAEPPHSAAWVRFLITRREWERRIQCKLFGSRVLVILAASAQAANLMRILETMVDGWRIWFSSESKKKEKVNMLVCLCYLSQITLCFFDSSMCAKHSGCSLCHALSYSFMLIT